MDAIKKKMQSLKSETDNSLARAEQLDTEAKEANALAEKTEEHVSIEIIFGHFFDYRLTSLLSYFSSNMIRCFLFRFEIFKRRCNMSRMSWM